MKHLLLLLLALSWGRLSAQQPSEAEDQRIMRESTFVFEGTVVGTTEYLGPGHQRVYRASTIQVTRQAKGLLTSSTVKVVYRGPKVLEAKVDKLTGGFSYTTLVDNGHGDPGDNGLLLPAKRSILFFVRPLPAGYEARPAPGKANVALFEIVGAAFDTYDTGPFMSSVGGKFASKKALYDYLAQRYQLAMPADR